MVGAWTVPASWAQTDVPPETGFYAGIGAGIARDDGNAPAGCSNRSAVGAQVELFWNGRRQLQEVSGGSGFCSQNQRRLHYGLGASSVVDRVVIRWPSGSRQTIERPQIDMLHRVKEPDGR